MKVKSYRRLMSIHFHASSLTIISLRQHSKIILIQLEQTFFTSPLQRICETINFQGVTRVCVQGSQFKCTFVHSSVTEGDAECTLYMYIHKYALKQRNKYNFTDILDLEIITSTVTAKSNLRRTLDFIKL